LKMQSDIMQMLETKQQSAMLEAELTNLKK
jgi:hypothetical protein